MKFRKAKIIATLGPSSNHPKIMKQLVRAGTNVFRLNFSHGKLTDHLRMIQKIRALSHELQQPIGILADLPGPKLRTGKLKNGNPVYLARGKKCFLTTLPIEGTAEKIPVEYSELPRLVKRGDRILLADGLMELLVLRSFENEIECRVLVGGELRDRKGINLPNRHLDIPALTFRDRAALRLLRKTKVDFVALSFVQRPQDIELAQKGMRALHPKPLLIAKIEKPEAVAQIQKITSMVDGIMIARGDLGVEVPAYEVPVLQKRLIHLSMEKSIPVITATQMLESMIYNPRPTRAEATDVANAIWDGTDAVMLSAETATGRYPVQAVRMMASIIENAEAHPSFQWLLGSHPFKGDSQTVLQAATSVSQEGVHKAIVIYTETGTTAICLSKMRPKIQIIAITPNPTTYQKLSLIWGVKPYQSQKTKTVDDMIQRGDQILMKEAGLKRKDRVIIVAGTRLTSGATNLMKVHQVGESI